MKLERHVSSTFGDAPPADASFCIIQSSLAAGATVRTGTCAINVFFLVSASTFSSSSAFPSSPPPPSFSSSPRPAPTFQVANESVVEYSRLDSGSAVGVGALVSCCSLAAGVAVPDYIFLHTSYLANGKAVATVLGEGGRTRGGGLHVFCGAAFRSSLLRR